MPYCSECGAEIRAGAKFCQVCGAKAKAREKRQMEAKPSPEVIDDCGDGIVFEEPMEAPPSHEAPVKVARTKMILPKGTRRIMLLAGIAIIVVAIVGVYMLVGGSQGGVPVYPGATEYQYEGQTVEQLLAGVDTGLPAGWSVKLYQTTSFTGTMMNWYRSNMPEWTDVYDETLQITSDATMGVLGFTKGSDGAFVMGLDYLENHYLVLMTGPAADMEALWGSGF